MARSLRWLFVVSLVFGFSSPLPAAAPSGSANIFHPTMDDSPYFTVYGSQTIQPWRYQLGGYLHLAKNTLEVEGGGFGRRGVLNNLLMGDFSGALGITDWFQVGLGVPVGLYVDFTDPNPPRLNEKSLRMGDVRIEPKLRLLDIDRYSVGLAVVPFVTLPTGSGSRFIGNNVVTGGGKLVADIDIRRRVQVSINLGLMIRKGVLVVNTQQASQLTGGLGVNYKLFPRTMHLIAEMNGATNVGNFLKQQSESPLEVDAGLRFLLPKPSGMAITVGGGAGITSGFGSPTYRILAGISYPNPRLYELPLPPPPPPPPPEEFVVRLEKKAIVISRAIHFEFNKAVIRPISFSILDAVVEILKTHPDVLKVRVEGHTDSKGDEQQNMRLSQRRANAVREYLVSHGVNEKRLVAVGYGKTRPLDTNESPEGRARNRRVEFIILEQEGQEGTAPPETSPQ